MNRDILLEHVEQGWISETKHSEYPIYIYNYTPATQYEQYWNDYTLSCRGLILDESGYVVARPFKKFFNWEEHPEIHLKGKVDIYDKMDGSLGILFNYAGNWYMATRGSFTSDQAVKGLQMWKQKYGHLEDKLDLKYTYLFEIIYPENRIVVDYGGAERLVLLSVIESKSGYEIDIHDPEFEFKDDFDIVNYHSIEEDDHYNYLKSLNLDNSEGFVLRDEDNFRVKIKFEEYVRLHRILTNTSTKTIWESLKSGMGIDELIKEVPDEFYDWVKQQVEVLEAQYNEIESKSKIIHNVALDESNGDRKRYAELVLKNKKYSSICFNMLDGKDYSEIIWKMIKPEYSKPFSNNNGDD